MPFTATPHTSDSDPVLVGGGRFAVRVVGGDIVEKTGDPRALAREGAALRRVAGRDVAPALVSLGDGILRSERLGGRPRALVGRDSRKVGVVLRRAHDSALRSTGRLPGWKGSARSLSAYRNRRAKDALDLTGPKRRPLAMRVIDTPPALPPADPERPFRLLHGDLVGENIVWTPQGPRLVDWEFWRMGDPAEDLAYLVELNALGPRVTATMLAGYGVEGMGERVDAWRALVALDAGAWYLAHGDAERGERLLARAARLAGVR
jgi:aminoglycoside phosphotransferase (APT) family kinase protein